MGKSPGQLVLTWPAHKSTCHINSILFVRGFQNISNIIFHHFNYIEAACVKSSSQINLVQWITNIYNFSLSFDIIDFVECFNSDKFRLNSLVGNIIPLPW